MIYFGVLEFRLGYDLWKSVIKRCRVLWLFGISLEWYFIIEDKNIEREFLNWEILVKILGLEVWGILRMWEILSNRVK